MPTGWRRILLWHCHMRTADGHISPIPSKTYLPQFYTDTGCSMEDLPKAMGDRDEWRERVKEIWVNSMPWLYIYIYVCVCVCVCEWVHTYIQILRILRQISTWRQYNTLVKLFYFFIIFFFCLMIAKHENVCCSMCNKHHIILIIKMPRYSVLCMTYSFMHGGYEWSSDW